MNWKRLFLPVLGLLIVGGVVFGGAFDRLRNTDVTATVRTEVAGQTLRPQAGTPRSWRERPSEKLLTVTTSPEVTLFGPLQVEIGPQDEIFVQDSGDLSIKRFAADGTFLTRYGKGKGQGPGEMLSMTGFAVGDDGEVWVADLTNGRITVFAPSGDVARTLRMEIPPYRLALGPDGHYVVMYGLMRGETFGRFGPANEPLGSFATFLEDQGFNAMLLDGWIAPTRPEGFAYVTRYAGLLAAFDGAGQARFYTELVDRPPLPKIIRGAEKRSWVDREAPLAAAGISATDKELYVLSSFQDGLKRIGALDTYSLVDGRYTGSYRLPTVSHSLRVAGDFLYTVHDVTITKWRLPPA